MLEVDGPVVSCCEGRSSWSLDSSEGRDVAAVLGDAHEQMCVAPSSRLGGNRDSGDNEAPLEAAPSETAAFSGSACLCQ